MPLTTEEIYVKNIDKNIVTKLMVNNDVVTIENDPLDNFFTASMPLLIDATPVDKNIRGTAILDVPPSDPRYALALQEKLPDGFLVEGAKISGKLVSWGDLIKIGNKLGTRRITQ